MKTAPAPQGHNAPPTIAEILKEKHEKLIGRAEELCAAVDLVPQTIDNEETAAKAADLIKLITGAAKNLEGERVSEKEPFLIQGRQVDGFFKAFTDRMEAAKRRVNAPLGDYLRRKEAKERRDREEAARILREQEQAEAKAAELLRQAQQAAAGAAMADQAAVTQLAANSAQKAAEVKPAELSRTRSAEGSVASLRTVWVGELVDQQTLDLEKLRHHLSPDVLQKAINSFVRAGGRELAGARIMEKTESVVR